MTISAREVFDAMPPNERHNLARLSWWFRSDYTRKDDEHLLGPEYESLRIRGVITNEFVSVEEGRPVRITDLGRAVLRYIEGGS